MIKECNVISRNSRVSVVKFDDKKLQIPTSDLVGTTTAYIKYDKKKYTVVSEEEYNKSNKKKTKDTSTVNEETEETETVNEEITDENKEEKIDTDSEL